MKQDERFNNIFNECLDRMFKGETIDQCLLKYPEQAKELEPLLRTALAARTAANIQPNPQFKARARYEFQAALRDMSAKKKRRRFSFNWRPQWQWQTGWGIAIIAVIVIVLGGGSTVAASSSSMPDNALYSVKLASEQVQLAVTPSDLDKAELNAKFADRRAEEIVYLTTKGNEKEVQVVAQRLNTNLQNMTNLAGKKAGNGATANNLTSGSKSANGANFAGQNGKQPATGSVNSHPPETPSILAGPASTSTQVPPAKGIAPTPTAPPAFSASHAPGNNASAQSAVDSAQNTRNSNSSNNAKLTKKEKLEQIITNNFNNRQTRLENALKDAPPKVKPALTQALAQSQAEYERAILNIEQAASEDN